MTSQLERIKVASLHDELKYCNDFAQVFKRSGNDLIVRMNIELVEALCGFQKAIRTLDDRDIVITVMPGEVTKHGEVKCVMNEGEWGLCGFVTT